MPIQFQHPAVLGWLGLVVVAAVLFTRAAVKRRKAIAAFGGDALVVSRKREAWSTCAAIGLVVLALARPAWDLEEQQLQETGRDVIFLLDVSRSMLAEDMHPNRLENAKTAHLGLYRRLVGRPRGIGSIRGLGRNSMSDDGGL